MNATIECITFLAKIPSQYGSIENVYNELLQIPQPVSGTVEVTLKEKGYEKTLRYLYRTDDTKEEMLYEFSHNSLTPNRIKGEYFGTERNFLCGNIALFFNRTY